MKKAVIICILSLSLCLSRAAPPADTHVASEIPTPNETKPNEPSVKTIVQVITTETSTAAPKATSPQTPIKPEGKPVEPDNKKPEDPTANEKKSADAHEEKKPGDSTSAPNTKPEDNKTEKHTEAATDKTTEKPVVPEKITEKAESKPDGKVTTLKPATEKPSEAPKSVTEKPPQAARGFDGPSFIGGIILALGLLAIGFMGFKYYKNQTERNYHTL